MPVIPTYPGVYIEELPSDVRTIAGVSTSVAAFVGRAKRGPVDDPRVINSYADFENTFGGLWEASQLGYAVRDFFLNGGKQAVIVRVYNAPAPGEGEEPPPTLATLNVNELQLEAASPGLWGNHLRARIEHPAGDDDDTLFHLAIRFAEGTTEIVESFRSVSSSEDHPRYVKKIVTNESRLVRVAVVPDARPEAHAAPDPFNADKTLRTTTWGDLPEGMDASQATNTAVAEDGMVAEENDIPLVQASFTEAGDKKGLYALDKADIFNLLCIPPYTEDGNTDAALYEMAAAYCQLRRAFLIIDPPAEWNVKEDAISGVGDFPASDHAAIFFPRIIKPDPLQDGELGTFAPCGAIAGVFARTDVQRGVWKAPAGLDATLVGVPSLSVPLTDAENGELNPLGINCLRALPAAGRVIWGSRTRRGADQLASQWKYIPIRRLALYIEESLYRGTQWVVFEPNDAPLWAQIRLNVGAFMHTLFRQGAFQGSSPKQAYFVKCDSETTPQADIDRGIVNIVVGFAPLKPAEFVIIKIQQIAGQLEV